jgi:uncharacterized protein (DUF2062 family)
MLRNKIRNQPERAGRLNYSLKRAYERFLKIRGSPRKIALGFALGLFIGMTPTMGFQMPIAVFVAALFKWNKISAAVAVWITNPLTAPFIYGFSYFVGAKMLGFEIALKPLSGLDFPTLREAGAKILLATIVGGVVVGIPLALLGYYLAFSAVHGYQTKLKHRVAAKKEKLARKIKRKKGQKSKKRKYRCNDSFNYTLRD